MTAEATLSCRKAAGEQKGHHIIQFRYNEAVTLSTIRTSKPEKATGIMILANISGKETGQNVLGEVRPPSVNSRTFMPK
jgi:hypothetical protein